MHTLTSANQKVRLSLIAVLVGAVLMLSGVTLLQVMGGALILLAVVAPIAGIDRRRPAAASRAVGATDAADGSTREEAPQETDAAVNTTKRLSHKNTPRGATRATTQHAVTRAGKAHGVSGSVRNRPAGGASYTKKSNPPQRRSGAIKTKPGESRHHTKQR